MSEFKRNNISEVDKSVVDLVDTIGEMPSHQLKPSVYLHDKLDDRGHTEGLAYLGSEQSDGGTIGRSEAVVTGLSTMPGMPSSGSGYGNLNVSLNFSSPHPAGHRVERGYRATPTNIERVGDEEVQVTRDSRRAKVGEVRPVTVVGPGVVKQLNGQRALRAEKIIVDRAKRLARSEFNPVDPK